MKPLIGVTCSWDEESGRLYLGGMYLEAVAAGGGIPLPLAFTGDSYSLKRIAAIIDGLVLTGGPDADPSYIGEDPVPACGEICPDRDYFEINLARSALASGIPILGICRGLQVMNIAAGGDIYQDLGSLPDCRPVKHFQQAPRWHPTHEIEVAKGTSLAAILGPGTLRVNSYHHQAVRRVAPGFIVAARSSDGVIEALEFPGQPFVLGVQCHPETMWKRHPVFLNLFKKLAGAAKKTKSEANQSSE